MLRGPYAVLEIKPGSAVSGASAFAPVRPLWLPPLVATWGPSLMVGVCVQATILFQLIHVPIPGQSGKEGMTPAVRDGEPRVWEMVPGQRC